MTKESSVKWMEWYKGLSEEDRKEYNQHRASRDRFKQARYQKKSNLKYPGRQKCYSHDRRIRKEYIFVLTLESPNIDQLYEWYLQNYDKPCMFCGQNSDSIDHIQPLSRGGKHEFKNMRVICNDCNIAKLDRTEVEWIHWLNLLHENYFHFQGNQPGIELSNT